MEGRECVFVKRVTGVRGLCSELGVIRGRVREKEIVGGGDSEEGGGGVRGKGRRKRRRGRVSLVCHGVFRQPEQQGQPG